MKYFVVSDIHGFYDEFRKSLKTAGYDKKNKEHTLIVCGDIFDRGEQSVKIYKFLKSIPKKRKVLIRGNHEYLLRDLLDKSYPQSHDISNGTVGTIAQFSNYELIRHPYFNNYVNLMNSDWIKIRDNFKDTKIVDWIFSKDWVDYYELYNYIFVHSFIPLYSYTRVSTYFDDETYYKYNKDWRTNSTKGQLEAATWDCPWKLYLSGLFDEEIKKKKVLVCGHWHVWDFYRYIGGKFYLENDKYDYDIFYSKNLIALDACTAYSNQVNVLVIKEDKKCYDQYGNLLVEKNYDDSDRFK